MHRLVELLLAHRADPDLARASDGATALYVAAFNGRLEVVRVLLAYQGRPQPGQQTRDGATALYVAAQNNHPEVVRLLLAHQADPNRARNTGGTALYVAARTAIRRSVRLLLAHQADPNLTRTSDGATALYVAAFSGHPEVVRLLLAYQADPNLVCTSDGATPLYTAAFSGQLRIVELLLAHQADPNLARTFDGATALHVAAQNGHPEVVRLLLAHQADPGHACTSDGVTALHVAARNGHTVVVAILSGAGPLSPTDVDGNTPLHDAVRNHHPVVVILLLQAGVDPSLQNTAGLTALSVLNRQTRPFTQCQQAIVELLRRKSRHRLVRWLRRWLRHQNTYGEHTFLHEVIRLGGAESVPTHSNNLEMPRLDGCTPLHLAVLHGNAAAVAELVIQGVGLSPLDLQNETPLQLALQGANEPIINILGPAVITVGAGGGMDSNVASRGYSVDKGLLSALPVFSLQDWVANALRRWLTSDEIRALLESGALPPGFSVLVLGMALTGSRAATQPIPEREP